MITRFCARRRADDLPQLLRRLDLVPVAFHQMKRMSALIATLFVCRDNGTMSRWPCAIEFGVPQRGVRQRSMSASIRCTPSSKVTCGRHPSMRVILLIFGKGAVRLAGTLGHVNDFAAQQLDQLLIDCGLPAPTLKRSPTKSGLGRGKECRRDVGHVDEVARLRSVADHGKRLSGELLPQEHAEHRAIGAGRAHARTVGVENADRVDRQP